MSSVSLALERALVAEPYRRSRVGPRCQRSAKETIARVLRCVSGRGPAESPRAAMDKRIGGNGQDQIESAGAL